MNDKTQIYEALQYVRGLFRKKLPKSMYYHDIKHTLEVYRSAIRYGKMEGLSKKDITLLALAGIFHDTGYVRKYNKNEHEGADIAKKYLTTAGFGRKEISIISKLILATQMPQRPKNLMQEIICDSDLDSLGRRDFFLRGSYLRKELETRRGFRFSDKEWDMIQIKFLASHKYFTESARKMRCDRKKKNLKKLKQMLLNA